MGDLVIKDLTVEYPSAGFMIRPIDELSVTVPSGSLALLLGPSGSGKTTLLSCLAGLQTPTSGTMSFDGEDMTSPTNDELAEHRRHRVGIVFQAFNLIGSLTALENVEVPMLAGGKGRSESRARATELLERVGLGERLRHRPGMLSGGQQQRVALARALAWDPPVVLADEPTAHLDYIQVEEVLILLRELAQPGRVVVVATHDERLLPLGDIVIDLAPKAEQDGQSRRGRPVTVKLEPEEILFAEGSAGDRIYRVETGEIELIRLRAGDGEGAAAEPREQVLQVARSGDFFGEMAPLFGLPRSATARARTAASLTGYTVRQLREIDGGVERLATLAGSRVPGRGSSSPRPQQDSEAREAEPAKAVAPPKTKTKAAPAKKAAAGKKAPAEAGPTKKTPTRKTTSKKTPGPAAKTATAAKKTPAKKTAKKTATKPTKKNARKAPGPKARAR